MDVKKGPILYVEDSKSDQKLFELALFELDIPNQLVIAEDGITALDFIRSSPVQPFIIFSDINMPKMTGVELKQEIEADPVLKQKSIPFVFISSSATKEEIDKAFYLGVQGYFLKPQSLEELEEIVDMSVKYWKRCKHPNNLY